MLTKNQSFSIKNNKNNVTKKDIYLFGNKIQKMNSILKIIFTLILISLFNINSCQNELAKNLEEEFNRISNSFPENWEKYFISITSMGQIKLDHFHINDLEHRLSKNHRFIDEIITNFKSIIYEQYTIFKTFSFSVNSFYSNYREFVGAARIINDKVELAYIEIGTFSNLIPQYNIVPMKRCETKFFFFENCYHYNELIPRGYTLNELELILQTLKAHSYKHLLRNTKNVLSGLQSKHFVLAENSPYFSEDGKYFLRMQDDGNLVIYETNVKTDLYNDRPVWHSGTYSKGSQPYMLVIENDGEMIIYDEKWNSFWKTETSGKGIQPYNLVLGNDGILKLLDSKGDCLWKTYKEN